MINSIKAIFGNPSLSFKMNIRLVYTEANVCVKIQKVMSCKDMATFYEWGSTVSRLKSLYDEIVYFLSFSFQVSRSS